MKSRFRHILWIPLLFHLNCAPTLPNPYTEIREINPILAMYTNTNSCKLKVIERLNWAGTKKEFIEFPQFTAENTHCVALAQKLTRCLGHINVLIGKSQTERALQTTAVVIGSTLSALTTVITIALPEGTRDARIATASASAVSTLLTVIGGLIGKAEQDANKAVQADTLYNKAKEILNKLVQQSGTMTSQEFGTELLKAEGFLDQCGSSYN